MKEMGKRGVKKRKTERRIQSFSTEEENLGAVRASEVRNYLHTKNLTLLTTLSQRTLALLFWIYW